MKNITIPQVLVHMLLFLTAGISLRATAQNLTVVDTKIYDNIVKVRNNMVALKFRFIDKDNNPNTIEKVDATSTEFLVPGDLNSKFQCEEVESVNNYTIDLVGSDGKKVGTIRHSQLEVRGRANSQGRRKYFPIANNEIVAQMSAFANSNKNNGAVKVKSIENTLYARYNSWPLDIGKPSLDWMPKTMQSKPLFGTLIGSAHLTTKLGTYDIEYYSTDKNTHDAETIVFTRDDSVRFKLDQLRIMNLKVVAEASYDDEPMPFACLDISWPNVGTFSIFDNELAVQLIQLAQSPEYAKAVNMNTTDIELEILSDGSFIKPSRRY